MRSGLMVERRPSLLSALLSLLLVGLVLAYPFLVHRYIEDISPRWFAGVLLVAVAIRFTVSKQTKQMSDWLMLGIVSGYCLCVAILGSEQMLKFYPVLMNVFMGAMFIASLAGDQCLIDKFARLGGKTPPQQAYGYLRTLTLLWGVLLIANGAVSAYTAWYTSLSVWALYNGLLSYVLLLAFAAGEWVFRGYYKKKHNIIDD